MKADKPLSQNSLDQCIRLYAEGVDRTLLRRNLRLTPTERFQQAEDLQRFARALREAGQRARRR